MKKTIVKTTYIYALKLHICSLRARAPLTLVDMVQRLPTLKAHFSQSPVRQCLSQIKNYKLIILLLFLPYAFIFVGVFIVEDDYEFANENNNEKVNLKICK